MMEFEAYSVLEAENGVVAVQLPTVSIQMLS